MSGDLGAQNPIRRSVAILGAVAMGLGLGGFLVGITEPVHPTRAIHHGTSASASATAPTAPSYRDILSSTVGPNRQWESRFASLKQDVPGLFDPVVRTPAMKEAALQDRLRTRAFDGAPPVIPHRVEQQSAASCLVCHGDGLRLDGRIATKVSHPHFANCLQCHVEQSGSLPWDDNGAGTALAISSASISVVNEFSGLLRAGPGTRAMMGAPPTVPHATHLREDCLSCHGLVARPGLRTTHPWLQDCVQCHVTSASLERPLLTQRETEP